MDSQAHRHQGAPLRRRRCELQRSRDGSDEEGARGSRSRASGSGHDPAGHALAGSAFSRLWSVSPAQAGAVRGGQRQVRSRHGHPQPVLAASSTAWARPRPWCAVGQYAKHVLRHRRRGALGTRSTCLDRVAAPWPRCSATAREPASWSAPPKTTAACAAGSSAADGRVRRHALRMRVWDIDQAGPTCAMDAERNGRSHARRRCSTPDMDGKHGLSSNAVAEA